MTLSEIKKAVDEGKKVYWCNLNYEVRKNEKSGEYYIVSRCNANEMGLTWRDGVTMNGEEKDFFMFHE